MPVPMTSGRRASNECISSARNTTSAQPSYAHRQGIRPTHSHTHTHTYYIILTHCQAVVHIHLHSRHALMHTALHTKLHTYTQAHTHTHADTIHKHTHTHTRTRKCTCTCTYTHVTLPLNTPHRSVPSNECAGDKFSLTVSVSSLHTYTTPAVHTVTIDKSFTAVSTLVTCCSERASE